MLRLHPTVQHYAWGSLDGLARVLGRAPSGRPEAELWLGAHPHGPCRVEGGASLEDVVAAAPEAALGAEVLARHGPQLPFLFKVLSAGAPLSLQAHPSLAQARAGFAREEAAGIPRDDGRRSYRDANHKPELLVALTPFSALCGFRAAEDTRARLAVLGLDAGPLGERGLKAWCQWLWGLGPAEVRALVAALERACAAPPPGLEAECRWLAVLAGQYPSDAGVLVAVGLHLVELPPGRGLFLAAGTLHAHLAGTGLEVMAASDNVLRGGLTPKHVDVPQLLEVVHFAAGAPALVEARPSVAPGEWVYPAPAAEFRLSRCEVEGGLTLPRRGPDVLLCLEGEVSALGLTLTRGQAAFAAHAEGPLGLAGRGVVWRSTVGGPSWTA